MVALPTAVVVVVAVARVARIKVLNFYIRFCIVLNVGFAPCSTEPGVSRANAGGREKERVTERVVYISSNNNTSSQRVH